MRSSLRLNGWGEQRQLGSHRLRIGQPKLGAGTQHRERPGSVAEAVSVATGRWGGGGGGGDLKNQKNEENEESEQRAAPEV